MTNSTYPKTVCNGQVYKWIHGETHNILQLSTAAEIIEVRARGCQGGKIHFSLLTIDLLAIWVVLWSQKTYVACVAVRDAMRCFSTSLFNTIFSKIHRRFPRWLSFKM